MKTVKRTMTALCLTALLCCLLCVSAYATGTSGGTGDVASAVENLGHGLRPDQDGGRQRGIPRH